jgi:uncharacterized protein YutD
MAKCLFCDNDATVLSNWGYICGDCYFTLKGFYEKGKKPEEMTMKELQILERVYTIWATDVNEVLQKIKNEIGKRKEK